MGILWSGLVCATLPWQLDLTVRAYHFHTGKDVTEWWKLLQGVDDENVDEMIWVRLLLKLGHKSHKPGHACFGQHFSKI